MIILGHYRAWYMKQDATIQKNQFIKWFKIINMKLVIQIYKAKLQQTTAEKSLRESSMR